MPLTLAPDDRHLASYLLGLLPEEEAERLDEASVVDDELASRLCGVEDDLVDAYELMVHPLVLGTGKRLFREEPATPIRLRLVESRPTTTGVPRAMPRRLNSSW